MSEPRTTYSDAGVDYGTLDAGKRSALTAALATSALALARGATLDDDSRGEPAVVFEFEGRAMAMVLEGLGTKSVIARQVEEQLGIQRFDAVAIDTVAAIVNDLCCVGALPLVLNAYFSTGASSWYEAPGRSDALIDGWQRACVEAGCAWGGGESPTLPGLVAEDDIELAGCAVGVTPPGVTPILGAQLAPGDEIVFVASSGLHANGASMARLLASREADGYATRLTDGRMLGEALLDPSLLYAGLVEKLLTEGVPVTYLSHVTGHGFLKLMRPRRDLGYRIDVLPEVPPVLAWMVERAGMDAHAAYSTFNMGVGYAVYCAAGSGAGVVEIAEALGHAAAVSGAVVQGPRRVIVEPAGVEFAGEEMDLGPGR
jgi:phosphoribosylformylglycinamidine cyclo-ligase